ncbi:MAG: hypothetical protein A3E88_00010 [Legionellales bacterium RIFCSPHIGHO2_12_FULL_35_11]|nr:MAG: hypothetical protein A3E88_00010 [Legionellales bacterium RIFCSPHIGHO2_12_FULL_35_11]
MLTITSQHKIYVACRSFDFRTGIDGFVAICRKHFNLDPLKGYCFIFSNKAHTAIKILLYDHGGFWLCHKRLSKGRFRQWPTHSTDAIKIDSCVLNRLLSQ